MKYGERLKELRNKKGFSQQELTDRLNINRSTYARYELCQTQPDFDTLDKLANFYDVTVDYLLGRSDDPTLTAEENDDYIEIKELIEKMKEEGKNDELEQLKSYTKWLAHDLEKD